MWSFFAAFFLGSYFVCKGSIEAAKGRSYETARAAREKSEERLKAKYMLPLSEWNKVVDYVLCGRHYDEICRRYKEDFDFVFRNKKDKKPLLPPYLGVPKGHDKMLKIYHPYWIVSLICADKGKVSYDLFNCGMSYIPNTNKEDIYIRFAQRVEKHLNDYNRVRGDDEKIEFVITHKVYEYEEELKFDASICCFPCRRAWK